MSSCNNRFLLEFSWRFKCANTRQLKFSYFVFSKNYICRTGGESKNGNVVNGTHIACAQLFEVIRCLCANSIQLQSSVILHGNCCNDATTVPSTHRRLFFPSNTLSNSGHLKWKLVFRFDHACTHMRLCGNRMVVCVQIRIQRSALFMQ